jgi:hypothetical protein
MEYREIRADKVYKEQIQGLRDHKGIKAIKAGREIKVGRVRGNKVLKPKLGNSMVVDCIVLRIQLHIQQAKTK